MFDLIDHIFAWLIPDSSMARDLSVNYEYTGIKFALFAKSLSSTKAKFLLGFG
jgi:hypothetical protein